MAESFFAALKNERVHRTVYPTREHARQDVARYIEFRYTKPSCDSATLGVLCGMILTCEVLTVRNVEPQSVTGSGR